MMDALLMQPSVDLLALWESVVGRGPRNDAADVQIAPYILQTHFRDAPEDALKNFGLTLHARAAWACGGFPTFRASQSLTAALLMTDSDSVPLEQVHYPFDTFVLQFPGPDYLLRTPSLPSEDPAHTAEAPARDIVGVLVQVLKTPKASADYQRLHEAMIAGGERAKADGLSAGLQAAGAADAGHAYLESIPCVRGMYMGLLLGPMSPEYQGEIAKRRQTLTGPFGMLPDGRHPLYAPVLSSYMENRGPTTVGELLDDFKTTTNFHGNPEIGKATLGIMHTAGRLVMNLALYVTQSEAADPRGKPVRASPVHPVAARRAAVQPRVWAVGNEIKLSKEVRAAAKNVVKEGHGRMPWRISARFIVRGHFREQPYGPERSLRRRQWIAPYWKGEDAAVTLTRQYAVGEDSNPDGGGR